ncbi:MAG: adenylate kinase [Acidimicrobiales bacterium]
MVPGGRFVVLGRQGAGKGTQCARLSHHYVLPHIATGDMLRASMKAHTPLGLDAKAHIDAGRLVPDEIVLQMVAERLEQDDTKSRGFVFDGFPRTVGQAKGLDEMLAPAELDLAIDLDVPMEVVLRRLASRRVCEDCGEIYSTEVPPRLPWICDMCGGEVLQREDDTEEAIAERLRLYDAETAPLIAWYEEAGKLVTLDGLDSPDAVTRRLVRAIDERRGDAGFGPPLYVDSGEETEPVGGGAPS